MAIPSYSADQLLAAFKRTLYRGRAWPRGTDTVMHVTLSGFMPAPARFIAAARNLVPDVFPSTTTSVLPEWEASLGLPDPCAGESPTIEERRAQVVARLTDSGGASIPYYVQFAKTLGYNITITEFAAARAGALRAGQPCCGTAWAYAWQVNALQTTVTRFAAGQSYAGDALANWGNAVLECEIRARVQAHTIVMFAYG
ncbi:YmfQ family protein [Komagataeibacter xylinus]|uniref:DUF2313 domain-containing protein n=1 Tax=Komagataeibacter xylinus TaxID=28448 RepID=A0A857FQ77_KOMXY|nr:putative phage tail protein [Komagataeibacter xylinus]QHC36468.1 DUF2313 domain-containing protein [Komagataeibacter xylinus]